MKRGIIIFLTLTLVLFPLVLAQNQYSDEELEEELNAGITPDSFLYFLDKLFEDTDSRAEKVAEIREMVKEGKINEARDALVEYEKYAEEITNNPDPSKRDVSIKQSAAIKKALGEIESTLSNEDKEDFYADILDKESELVTALEISNKIKELCISLSELDPAQYATVCKTTEDSPEWQKNLDDDLTDDQKREALEFGEIMSECFRTSGETCRCEEISFTDFAEQCSIIAPLAYQCDILDKKEACNELDEIERENDPFELLPDYLLDVIDEIEEQYEEDKFDHHIPKECEEAEAFDRESCEKIMIETHAPEECIKALNSGEIEFSSEREFRKKCESIMMNNHAPECAEQGLTDPEECKDFMWNIDNRPSECQENQIHDYRDCKKFLEEGGNKEDYGPGFGGFDCSGIEDSQERLECYDSAAKGIYEKRENFDERYAEIKEKEKQCADECSTQGGAWDFTNGECSCHFFNEDHENSDENWNGYDCASLDCQQGYHCEPDFGCVSDEGDNHNEDEYNECRDGCSDECPGADRTDCVDGNRCECYYDDDSGSDDGDDSGSDGDDSGSDGDDSGSDDGDDSGSDGDDSGSDDGDDSGSDDGDDSGSDDGDDSGSDDGDDSGSSSPITGNAFLDYFD